MSIQAFALFALSGMALASPTGLQRRAVAVGNDVSGPFRNVNITDAAVAGNANCEAFSFDGPFVGMEFGMTDTAIATLKITDVRGKSEEITAGTATLDPKGFTLEGNQRITKMELMSNDEKTSIAGLDFTIDEGSVTQVRTGQMAGKTPGTTYIIQVGSGIIGRVSGSSCSDTSSIASLTIGYLDELASISVSNITYSGFVNNIADAGAATSLTVGSQILDNRNSSVQQQIQLTTTSATTRSYTLTTGSSYTVGTSTTIESKVGIPLLSEGKASGTASWSLTESTDEQQIEGETQTQAATFQLNCPAKTNCEAQASFLQFNLDVDVEVTMTATTKSKEKFDWLSFGNYKGADSLAMKTVVNEVGKA